MEEVISLLLEDTVNAREQQPDGSYKMVAVSYTHLEEGAACIR